MANPPHPWQNVASMQTRFVEARNIDAGGMNWGKFMVARLASDEWARSSQVGGRIMLAERGYDQNTAIPGSILLRSNIVL